jgi:hypothetical protein
MAAIVGISALLLNGAAWITSSAPGHLALSCGHTLLSLPRPGDYGARVRRTCFLAIIATGMVCGLLQPIMAQEPRTEADYYHTPQGNEPVEIHLDAIGLVLRPEVGGQQAAQQVAAAIGAQVAEGYHDILFVLKLPDNLQREELVKLAREVRQRFNDIVSQAGFVLSVPTDDDPVFVADELIVQFEPGIEGPEVEALNAANKVRTLTANPFVDGEYLLSLSQESPTDVFRMAQRYHDDPRTVLAVPHFFNVIEDRDTSPGDALFGDQWHHRNTGQSSGTVDADADTSMAWDITQGAPMIAVLENGGFDTSHPDILPNLGTNIGWDFSGCANSQPFPCGDADPSTPTAAAAEKHGTAAAGVAAARGGNKIGVVGACPRCSVMLLRTDPNLTGSDWAKKLAFEYAQNNNARIISNSWGGGATWPKTIQAVNTATAAGVVVLFAANNTSADKCAGPVVEPLLKLPSVIAVSSSSNQDRKVVQAGVGGCIDILAPSDRGYQASDPYVGTLDITTTDRTGLAGYNTASPPQLPAVCPIGEPSDLDYTNCFNGTSSATPLVAGIAGLVLSADNSLTREEVQRLLQDTADKVEPGVGMYADATGFSSPTGKPPTHAWGRVNAYEAVRIAAPTAAGGKGGVDVFLRDNRLDWGNTEQPSNTLFEATRGLIGHWRSMDIKVDAPDSNGNYQPDPTAATFDAFQDETPSAIPSAINRVWARVRNRGPNPASSVNIKLHWAQFGTVLPPLPADFWTAFPNNSTDPTSKWNPLDCDTGASFCTVTNLAYSGASVAGDPVADVAQIVGFKFPAPAINPGLPNHFCLLAMVDSLDDPISDDSKAIFVADTITPTDNNVTHRNYHNLVSGPPQPFRQPFFVRNPTPERSRTVLHVSAPKNWEVSLEPFAADQPFELEGGGEELATVTVQPPAVGATGEVTVIQEMYAGGEPIIGGFSYGFAPRK